MESGKLQEGRGRREKEQHADKCIFMEDKKCLFGSLMAGSNEVDYRLLSSEIKSVVRRK